MAARGQQPGSDQTGKRRAKRDPEGRRRTIVEAAAEILAHEGTRKLTHRRVAQQAGVPLGSTTQYFSSIDDLRRAGLEELGRLIERDYDEMFASIEARGGGPDAFIQEFNSYFADAAQVAADTAFYCAAASDPALQRLAQHSIELGVKRSLPYLDEPRAKALAVVLDGAMLESHLLGEPVDPAVIDFAVQAIFGTKPDPGNGAA
ncbi:MAG: TetR family transcriptional regulator [Eggerthellaceae bacterium]|nr:TetR family transcriptional regulator [Eggerthellaceae bacterium]